MVNTNTVPQGLFGPGILYLTRTDVLTTPVNVGYCNEFSLDISFDTKSLYGQNQYPLLCARGTAKSTGKIKAAVLSGQALNATLLGGTWTAGTQYDIATTAATAIPTTPFTITPTPPASGTWNADLGVINAATGQVMTVVPTGTPTTGQYKVAAGVYTFAAADNVSGISVIISYAYTATAQAGQSQIITNFAIGTTPTFQLDYKTALFGATYYIRLYQAIAGKLSLQHKLSDFAMPEYDFDFFANASQQVGIISVASQG